MSSAPPAGRPTEAAVAREVSFAANREEGAVQFRRLRESRQGRQTTMTPSSIVVILVGIVLALLVSYILGIIVILIGLAMLLFPMFGGTRRRV